MAEVTKYQLITSNNNNNNNNNIISELKTHFSLFKIRKSTSFIYGIVLIFVFFTIFLAFSPSSSSSSPWFVNIFAVNSTYSNNKSNNRSNNDDNVSSVYSYFFPNSTQVSNFSQIVNSRSQNNATIQVPVSPKLNNTEVFTDKVGNFEQNKTTHEVGSKPVSVNSDQVAPITVKSNDTHDLSSNPVNVQSAPLAPPPITPKINDSFSAPDLSSNPVNVQSAPFAPPPITPTINDSSSAPDLSSNPVNVQSAPLAPPPITPTINDSSSTHDPSSNPVSIKSAPVSPVTPKTNDSSSMGSNSVSINSPPPVAPTTPKTNQSSSFTPQTPQISMNSTKQGSGVEASSSDLSASLSKNGGYDHKNDTVSEGLVKKKGNNQVENLVGCNLYDGNWVKDESYPLYKPGSCKFIDEQFNCLLNGRPDRDFQKLKWNPNGCSIPRLNAGHMLEFLRGKRLVFVGDSLNRNMWESLVCILKNSVKHKKHVYEAYGRHHFRTEASYSFVFKDYNCTVEFFVSPFLVQQWEVKDKTGAIQETLRLDQMVSDADQFKSADFIVFNTGHWWTHDKTSKGEDYYQEGSHVYKQLDVTEAFRRAITTWARWVDANIDPQRTHVLFRGYSASHFSGGQWNSGGQCDSETEPIKNETYLTKYPWKMKVFERVIKNMKTPVSYLNITRSTDYRKDGHPSIYRKYEQKSPLRYQDCSHWCLPGVPDSWNELLYAELLRKQYLDQQQKNKT